MNNSGITLCILLTLLSQGFSTILNPIKIVPYQFSEEITGIPFVLVPNRTKLNGEGKTIEETYRITMKKTTQNILPSALKLPPTEIYAYGGNTEKGEVFAFPGPAIYAKQGVPIRVIWKNNLVGKHMFPVDVSEPFNSSSLFKNEVPTVPHAHGLVTPQLSDGGPESFWTASGGKSKNYHTEEPCQKNEAVYLYTNEQQPGLYWYHDHTYGITRLNVYAGLAGFYKIEDNPENGPESLGERNIRKYYGEELEVRYFGISDKTFNTDGSLYYPDKAMSSDFTSWIPQFFGNTIVVNEKVWPKVVLEKKKYRIVILNACQCRFLNLFFLYENRKLPFELIRMEGDYFPNPIVVNEYFLSLGARLEFILDLTQINGNVILKNNAAAPHPDGDPENLIDSQTGTIMKIETSAKKRPLFNLISERTKIHHNLEDIVLKENSAYPAFPEGEKIFATLVEFTDDDDESVGMMIDGIPMSMSENCKDDNVKKYKVNSVYDFYIINLTPDTHPMHFHLVNTQKVLSFPFDVERYTDDWYELNGEPGKRGFEKIPKMLDPELYRTGNNILPKPWQKVFRDVIDAFPDVVTVMRMKFSHNNEDPFTFNVSGSRYVWHCHMLEHEDNEMMKYLCME